MTRAHSPYGGSQVSRYMACPGSVALSQKVPPEKSSSYAEEGTFAHALAEECLLAGADTADKWIGKKIKHPSIDSEKVVTAELAAAVNVYLATIWSDFANDDASEIAIECKFVLDIEAAEGQAYGTSDCVLYQPTLQKLTIYDYKHGAGVLVDVEDSGQLKFYGIGALQEHPDWLVREIELVVVQPRAFNAGDDQGVKRWSLPMSDVFEFPYELNEAIAATKQPDAPVIAGEHCRFCPASTICTVREQAFAAACGKDFEGFSLPEIEQLQPDVPAHDFAHMARVIAAYEALGPWINDMRTLIDQELLAGGKVEGWKVVEKIARRKWTASDEEVAGWLEMFHGVPIDLSMPRTLVGITEAKKLLKGAVDKAAYAEAERDLTTQFTIKEASGLTTALESDRRPAVAPVSAEFGSVQLGVLEGVD